MNDVTDRALLIAELHGDLEGLPELLETNRKSIERIEAGAADELDFAALGYTLQNLYNLMENSSFASQSTSKTTSAVKGGTRNCCIA